MKKHLLALAALATVSGVAAAQNVTVYGAVDSGITNATKACSTSNCTTSVGHATSFLNGGLSPSIFGFRGSEDLGGGLKATFNLEGHLSTSNGSNLDASGSTIWGGLFGRQANLGLSGGFGSVTLGKQFNPAVLSYAATDPRGLKETYSGLISWLYAGNVVTNGSPTAPVNSNSMSDIFLANAISYSTSFNGLNVGAAYSIGGVANNNEQNSVTALGASYANSGFTVSASYTEDKGNSSTNTGFAKSKRSSVGVGYKVGQFAVKANYLEAKVNNTTATTELKKNQVYGVGVDYSWNAANTLTLAHYDSKNKTTANDTAKSWILSNDYALSKRTTVYALIASNKGGSAYSSAAIVGSTFAGETNTVTQLGINHKF
jgi:predicted porin